MAWRRVGPVPQDRPELTNVVLAQLDVLEVRDGICFGSLVEFAFVRPNVFSWSSSDRPLK